MALLMSIASAVAVGADETPGHRRKRWRRSAPLEISNSAVRGGGRSGAGGGNGAVVRARATTGATSTAPPIVSSSARLGRPKEQ
jgi:hypothetical protein